MTHALPNPENRFERYHVLLDDKSYIAEFFSGEAREVQVEVRSMRRGYHKPRTLWYGLSNGKPVPATGRAAEVLACINNPAWAKAHGARVEDHGARSARITAESEAIKARHAAWRAEQDKAKRLAEAAPDMFAALKAFVAAVEAEGDTALYAAPYRAAKAALALVS